MSTIQDTDVDDVCGTAFDFTLARANHAFHVSLTKRLLRENNEFMKKPQKLKYTVSEKEKNKMMDNFLNFPTLKQMDSLSNRQPSKPYKVKLRRTSNVRTIEANDKEEHEEMAVEKKDSRKKENDNSKETTLYKRRGVVISIGIDQLRTIVIKPASKESAWEITGYGNHRPVLLNSLRH